jgi:GNAT superfamily N-acetyltransferase
MSITLRRAGRADIPLLAALIERSAHGLSADDYTQSQVAGALRGAFGVDTQLVDDGTYFVAEEGGVLAGCGGWSFRATLFGSDTRTDRDASMLDPRTHAAKIRAFFVEPSHARRGVGSLLLERCETEARERGFSRVELMATLPGVKLYAARGYAGSQRVSYDLGNGEHIDFVPMSKALR